MLEGVTWDDGGGCGELALQLALLPLVVDAHEDGGHDVDSRHWHHQTGGVGKLSYWHHHHLP